MYNRFPIRTPNALVTLEEFKLILRERLMALEAATREVTLQGPLPPQWRWGWEVRWKALRRDSQGALLVSITVKGPQLTRPYVRNVRLVRKQPLPYGLGLG